MTHNTTNHEDMLNQVVVSDALCLLRKLPDSTVHAVVTDPPYPIDRDNVTGRLFHGHAQEKQWFAEDYEDWPSFFSEVMQEFVRVTVDGGHIYVFVNEANLVPTKLLLDKYAQFKSILVWLKSNGTAESYGMGYHYRKSCEYVLLYSNGKSRRHITDHGTLLHYPRDKNINHPTPKPTNLLRLLIEKSTEKGEIVLDPFVGSGSTAIAAKQSQRNFIAGDVSKDFVSLTKQRLSQVNMNEWFKVLSK